jgi:hypothetical protein
LPKSLIINNEAFEYLEEKAMKFILVCLFGTIAVFTSSIIHGSFQSHSENNDKKEVQKLLSDLRTEKQRQEASQKMVETIKRLGELRAQEAIPDLISLLSFQQTTPGELEDGNVIQEIHPITRSSMYPAVGALIRIGRPALQSLTTILGQNQPESLESKNAYYVVEQIFRYNIDEGAAYLMQTAATSTDTIAKARLLEAAQNLSAKSRKN